MITKKQIDLEKQVKKLEGIIISKNINIEKLMLELEERDEMLKQCNEQMISWRKRIDAIIKHIKH
jgi:peptidoglycan hydrolase CwlO-like protein